MSCWPKFTYTIESWSTKSYWIKGLFLLVKVNYGYHLIVVRTKKQ